MKSGLLWYDASASPIDRKIADAVKRYKEKFGVAPNTCFVNDKDFKPDATMPPQLRIAAKHTILPNHVWVGVSEK
ncbi:MAG: hypothetical protein ACM3JD_11245 [Rudaea sp.]